MVAHRENEMANKQPQIVNIDGTEHDIESMTQEQKLMLDHLIDLDRKIASVDFQRQQLSVGRDAFMGMLKKSLEGEDGVQRN